MTAPCFQNVPKDETISLVDEEGLENGARRYILEINGTISELNNKHK